ncbi:uncharacterized protein METZ01_LOCUS56422 [marine metagenome]|uniref:Uncharacterized protein n=1 Tax=marine metagenome TaxID=408172 RepID=A0A381SJW1_9ZZZZ
MTNIKWYYIINRLTHAGIAQLVEQLICNQQVVGSSPIASSSMGRYPSGQRDQTVNLTAKPSKVRILLSPPEGIRSLLQWEIKAWVAQW